MSKPTLQAVITQILRGSGIAGIQWGQGGGDSVGSPYYREVPEPPPPLPYVEFDIPDMTTIENFFEGGYEEPYKVYVNVYGSYRDIATLLSPYSTTSVLYFLDSLMNNKSLLAGDNFKVSEWFRDGWALQEDDNRYPTGENPPGDPAMSGGRVWVARATYSATVLFNGLG